MRIKDADSLTPLVSHLMANYTLQQKLSSASNVNNTKPSLIGHSRNSKVGNKTELWPPFRSQIAVVKNISDIIPYFWATGNQRLYLGSRETLRFKVWTESTKEWHPLHFDMFESEWQTRSKTNDGQLKRTRSFLRAPAAQFETVRTTCQMLSSSRQTAATCLVVERFLHGSSYSELICRVVGRISKVIEPIHECPVCFLSHLYSSDSCKHGEQSCRITQDARVL